MVGVSDRSDWYASSNYSDKNGKNVLIGWMLSVPREVGVAIVRDIYGVDQHVVGKGDWIVSDSKDIIKTLSVKPRSNLQLLRNENSLEHVASVSVNGLSQVLNSTGASFELIAEVADFERGSKVGFEVRRSSTGDEVATIVYDDAQKKMIIDRSKSLTADCTVFADNGVKPISESILGHFYLDVCVATSEKLGFHVFVDVLRVEVFVNNRFSLSARIYPCASQSKSDGIAPTASGDSMFRAGWPGSRGPPCRDSQAPRWFLRLNLVQDFPQAFSVVWAQRQPLLIAHAGI
ncbi:hypothetical protein F442_23051 [Phytophthora nicotianae P10297]|uniref:Glycosyl hydrolase family 32 C-terminal domain-containing protein n=2 Tax=Phytophthora nicotianae TaxID=4792 RepID=W2XY84_PHYNI|nr:hypothetical protein L917_01194 [Phytophthora nicotianae]ETP27671.1 hypothetical protein F442_23051 [Phytophthora nicotianae P10297]